MGTRMHVCMHICMRTCMCMCSITDIYESYTEESPPLEKTPYEHPLCFIKKAYGSFFFIKKKCMLMFSIKDE